MPEGAILHLIELAKRKTAPRAGENPNFLRCLAHHHPQYDQRESTYLAMALAFPSIEKCEASRRAYVKLDSGGTRIMQVLPFIFLQYI